MKYDIIFPIMADVISDPDWVTSFARTADRVGFDGVATSEHVVWVGDGLAGFLYGDKPVTNVTTMWSDPIELMSFVAGVTQRLDLVMATLVLPEHHPVVMAKRLATLDVLSKGRVRAGIGIGWNRDEMEACGQDFTTRGRRADEAMEIMRVLWSGSTQEGSSYIGKYYSFENVFCNPKPVRGNIPMPVGGSTEAAARRAGRLGEGFQPLNLEGEELAHMVSVMRSAAIEYGRDPDALEVILRRSIDDVTDESIAADKAAGVTRLILNGSVTSDLALANREIEDFAVRMGLG